MLLKHYSKKDIYVLTIFYTDGQVKELFVPKELALILTAYGVKVKEY